ncbi:MAG: O-antigen ligase family protein [Bacteroidales bacterium]|nr:O-antigen ligase family protein [Bacteroidales bacterium]
MNPLNILFSQNRHFNIFYVLMMLSVVTLPFTQALSVPIAILMLLNWFWEWNWKEKWMNVKDHQSTMVFILSAAVFFLPLFGLLISSNKMHALASVETYVWFLAAPLFLLTYPSTLLTRERTRILLVLFTISTIFTSFFIFGDAMVCCLKSGEHDFSFYHHISAHHHPSYLSLYMSCTIFLMLYDWKLRRKQLALGIKIIYGVLIAYLYIAVISSSSKAGLLILLALCLVWVFFLAGTWKSRLVGLGVFISVNFLFGLLLYQFHATPFLRMRAAWTDIRNYEVNSPYAYTSSGVRLTVWRCAWEVATDNHLLGTGTGDLTDDLIQNAEANGYQNLVGHHYNAHNQWLQALASTGLLGLLIVLAYCLFPIVYSIRKRDILYFTFGLLVIGNLCVESMFERKMGATFIAIMYVLLFLRIPKQTLEFNLGPSEETSDATPAPQNPSPEV